MKKKLGHIWHYYKWYLVAAGVVLILALNFVSEKRAQTKPDYQVAVVTGSYIPESTRDTLAAELERLWPDADGDGAVTVSVNFYQYDAETMESADTASFMASAVQLAADLQGGISRCFLTDNPDLLTENSRLTVIGTVEASCLPVMEELVGFTVLAWEASELTQALFPEK